MRVISAARSRCQSASSLPRKKRGERTTGGRHLCLMDRLKVRKTTRGPRQAASLPHSAQVSPQSPLPRQEKEGPFRSIPFAKHTSWLARFLASLGFDKVVRTKAGSDGFKGSLRRKTRGRRVELESPQTLFFFFRKGEEKIAFFNVLVVWVHLPNRFWGLRGPNRNFLKLD